MSGDYGYTQRPLSAVPPTLFSGRPESPRRPRELDPLPNSPPPRGVPSSPLRDNGPSSSSHYPPRPPSANRGSLSSPGGGSRPEAASMEGYMSSWLSSHLPAALEGTVTGWCNTNAQPLLSGFLESWMNMNSATVVQNELAKHLLPMQQVIQQQQQMIAELQHTAQEQQQKIAALEQAKYASLTPTHHHEDHEPAPFTPTLPFALSNTSIPTNSASSSSTSPSTSTFRSSSGRQLGLGGVSPVSTSAVPLVNEDGVAAPTEPKARLRQSLKGGLGLGLGLGRSDPRGPLGAAIASATTNPSFGETVISEESNATSPQSQQTRLGPAGGPRTAVAGGGGRPGKSGQIDIIVVEDLGVAQKIAHAALTRGHYKVDVAGDGLTAIELFKKHMGGLKAVLMDIHLPGISGIETTERIRKIEVENGVEPVFIYGLTGDVAEEDLIKYKACGMNGCILKGKLLADAVKQAMEESQNGVEFVNLCDKQPTSGSSSSSTHHTHVTPTNTATSPTNSSERAQASALERLRQEAAAGTQQPAPAFGTPRAVVPRTLLLDSKYPGRGQVKPGVGLPSTGGGGTSPGQVTERHTNLNPAGGGATGPNLLLVEDVRVSQKIASQALQRANFKVIVADDGEAAVEKYKQHCHSLRYVIMDINLPGISGIEATEQIRSIEKSNRVPDDERVSIFGLTGNVDPESMRNYELAGMNGCILKGKVLAEALKQAIEESQQGKFVNVS